MISLSKKGKHKPKRKKLRRLKSSTLRSYPLSKVMEIYDSGIITKLPQLELILDRLFGLYIRSQGDCVLRGIQKPWKCGGPIQNGHVFSRGCNYVKFKEIDCYPQCAACNKMHSTPGYESYYHDWLRAKIGDTTYEELKENYLRFKIEPYIISGHTFREKIAHYRVLVNL